MFPSASRRRRRTSRRAPRERGAGVAFLGAGVRVSERGASSTETAFRPTPPMSRRSTTSVPCASASRCSRDRSPAAAAQAADAPRQRRPRTRRSTPDDTARCRHGVLPDARRPREPRGGARRAAGVKRARSQIVTRTPRSCTRRCGGAKRKPTCRGAGGGARVAESRPRGGSRVAKQPTKRSPSPTARRATRLGSDDPSRHGVSRRHATTARVVVPRPGGRRARRRAAAFRAAAPSRPPLGRL